jgi:hypothetical protein
MMIAQHNFLTLLSLLLTLTTNVNAVQDDDIQEPGYIVCDWGLLVIHPNLRAPAVSVEATPEVTPDATEEPIAEHSITITRPPAHAGIAASGFTVTGTGSGLFEGNVVVQVQDADGNVLYEQPTTMVSDEVGGAGEWSLEVTLDGSLDAGDPATLYAYSTSPADGSVIAEAEVPVVFSPQAAEFPTIFYVDKSDPILENDDVCRVAETQSRRAANKLPVEVISAVTNATRSIPPQVQLSVQAMLPAGCPLPLRAYKTQDEGNLNIELYFHMPADAGCDGETIETNIQLPFGAISVSNFAVNLNGVMLP